jgi:hypothetical protein
MISPLKVWSFAAAKPGASNMHAVILTISFLIFFFLRIELLVETLSVLRQGSSSLGYQVENLPSSRVCRTFFSICLIEFADPTGQRIDQSQLQLYKQEISRSWSAGQEPVSSYP